MLILFFTFLNILTVYLKICKYKTYLGISKFFKSFTTRVKSVGVLAAFNNPRQTNAEMHDYFRAAFMSYIVNNPETKVSQTSIELNQNNQHMQILIAPHHSLAFVMSMTHFSLTQI
jgi:hypothetical protein